MDQILEFIQTPVGLGVAAIAAVLVFLIIRKLLSLLFLSAALVFGGWAVARHYDIPIPLVLPGKAEVQEAIGKVLGRSAVDAAISSGLEVVRPESVGAAAGKSAGALALAEGLKTAEIAFNAPDKVALNMPVTVRLAVDASGLDDLDAILEGLQGEVRKGEAALTNQVSASLTGDNFDIRLLDPQRQVLSDTRANTWQWEVTPRQAGQHTLTIRVFAHPYEDAAVAEVERFSDEIEVSVGPVSTALALAQKAHPVVGATAGVVSLFLAIMTWWRRRRAG